MGILNFSQDSGVEDFMMSPRSMGMLGLASGLLQASGPSRMPISLGGAIGEAVPRGMAAMQQAQGLRNDIQAFEIRRKLAELELQKAKRQEEADKGRQMAIEMLLGAQRTPTQVMRPDMSGKGMTGTLDTEDYPRQPETVLTRDRDKEREALIRLAQYDPKMQETLLKSLTDPKELVTVGKSVFRKNDDGTLTLVASDQVPDKKSDLAVLISERDALPPGDPRRRIYDEHLAKLNTPPQGVQVTMGSPQVMQGEDGNWYYWQPGNRPGQPGQPVKDPAGNPIQAPPPASTQPKEMNASQAKANYYVNRMVASDGTQRELEGNYRRELVLARHRLGDRMIGALAGGALNSEEQRVYQAQKDFINAILRPESGAVISPTEFESAYSQYFPLPGEDQAAVDQKARNRRIAIEGLKAEAGKNAPVNTGAGPTGGPPPGAVRRVR